MNTLELMDSKLSSFSKTDRSIYEMIKKFPADWAEGSITELSDIQAEVDELRSQVDALKTGNH